MLSPTAASENTRNGSITDPRKKSLPTSGITRNAMRRITAMPMRSSRRGNTAMSAA
jgi:hypothetical protein